MASESQQLNSYFKDEEPAQGHRASQLWNPFSTNLLSFCNSLCPPPSGGETQTKKKNKPKKPLQTELSPVILTQKPTGHELSEKTKRMLPTKGDALDARACRSRVHPKRYPPKTQDPSLGFLLQSHKRNLNKPYF